MHRKEQSDKICKVCGSTFTPYSAKSLTCSKKCSIRLQNDKKAAKRDARKQERHENTPCLFCGEKIPLDRRLGSIYCSFQCKHNAQSQRWREKSPGYMRQYCYGITEDEYQAMLDAQGNLCAICGSTMDGYRNRHVDHDHETGRVRGILCSPCNLMLGHAQDDPLRLRQAIDYLESHSTV